MFRLACSRTEDPEIPEFRKTHVATYGTHICTQTGNRPGKRDGERRGKVDGWKESNTAERRAKRRTSEWEVPGHCKEP